MGQSGSQTVDGGLSRVTSPRSMGAGNTGKVESRVDPKADGLMAVAPELAMVFFVLKVSPNEICPPTNTGLPSSRTAVPKHYQMRRRNMLGLVDPKPATPCRARLGCHALEPSSRYLPRCRRMPGWDRL